MCSGTWCWKENTALNNLKIQMDIKDTQEQQRTIYTQLLKCMSYKVNYKSRQEGRDTHSGLTLRATKL